MADDSTLEIMQDTVDTCKEALMIAVRALDSLSKGNRAPGVKAIASLALKDVETRLDQAKVLTSFDSVRKVTKS